MFKKRVLKKDNARSSEKRKLENVDLDDVIASETQEHRDELESSKKPNLATLRVNKLSGTGGFKKRKPLNDEKSKIKGKEITPLQNEQEKNDIESEEAKDTLRVTSKGTLKAIPVNIVRTTVTDFQPDVCKDFLQTGYCGYGDTCKFLHIRDELRQKKAINKEWETVGNSKAKRPMPSTSVSGDESRAQPHPFKCVLCKSDYKAPVITSCQHVFCQKCFLDRVKKKPNCFLCGKDTSGVCKPVLKRELEKLLDQ